MGASIYWSRGAPPEIGWWPASTLCNRSCIRWWNGKSWSSCVYPDNSAEEAGDAARAPAYEIREILWSKRWWK